MAKTREKEGKGKGGRGRRGEERVIIFFYFFFFFFDEILLLVWFVREKWKEIYFIGGSHPKNYLFLGWKEYGGL